MIYNIFNLIILKKMQQIILIVDRFFFPFLDKSICYNYYLVQIANELTFAFRLSLCVAVGNIGIAQPKI